MPQCGQQQKLDLELILPFVSSVREVLSTMVGVTPQVGKPGLKTEPTPTYDVSGIIGFSGQVGGTLVVSFQLDAAARLVAAFTGEQIGPDHPDFVDAIGELCNMIAGNAKKDFGLDASITVPSVVVGSDHRIARPQDVPCVAIPCKTDLGEFTMEIGIKRLVTDGAAT